MRDKSKPRPGMRVEFDDATKADFDFLKEQGFNMTQLMKNFIKAKADELKKKEEK